jgi:protein-S-isoprenylcysteine O-methyltransferase Ste14
MNNIKKYYPNILVALQFGIIGLMILLSHNFFKTLYPLAIFSLGAILGVWALAHNQLGNFNIQPKLKENCQLVTTGIYGYIRHPMYSSVILMMLSLVIASPTLLEILLFVALIVVLWLKAKREEMLWCGHDEAYIAYQKRSRFFIPFLL